jgi:hypothetical protein
MVSAGAAPATGTTGSAAGRAVVVVLGAGEQRGSAQRNERQKDCIFHFHNLPFVLFVCGCKFFNDQFRDFIFYLLSGDAIVFMAQIYRKQP